MQQERHIEHIHFNHKVLPDCKFFDFAVFVLVLVNCVELVSRDEMLQFVGAFRSIIGFKDFLGAVLDEIVRSFLHAAIKVVEEGLEDGKLAQIVAINQKVIVNWVEGEFRLSDMFFLEIKHECVDNYVLFGVGLLLDFVCLALQQNLAFLK